MYGRLLLRTEGLRTTLVIVAGIFLGGLLGQAWLGLMLSLIGLLLFHLRQAAILHYWSQAPKRRDLPGGSGIWREIFNDAYNQHKRSRKRKKRLGAILREFRASTAALPDAAVVLDRGGIISWSNDAAQSLLGLKTRRDQGQRISNLLRDPRFIAYQSDASRLSHGIELDSPILENRTLWLRLIPYGDQQKLLIARDVTAFKQLEKTRRDFVANASHELRTPLTVLRGYLEMMGEELPRDTGLALWEAPVQEMRKQASRMQYIIADLLKLANIEAGGGHAKHELVAMPALLAGLLEEIEQLAEDGQRVESEIDPDLYLLGSEAELHSVASNLLSNALRYTPPPGQISLRWYLDDSGAAVLLVRDTGIGISARDIPRLTERFYRADTARSRETGGTGLGLAITKHALERHEARLRIASQPGQGSEFSCRFPASRVELRQSNHKQAV